MKRGWGMAVLVLVLAGCGTSSASGDPNVVPTAAGGNRPTDPAMWAYMQNGKRAYDSQLKPAMTDFKRVNADLASYDTASAGADLEAAQSHFQAYLVMLDRVPPTAGASAVDTAMRRAVASCLAGIDVALKDIKDGNAQQAADDSDPDFHAGEGYLHRASVLIEQLPQS